jgi:hypothetical protein
MYVDFGEFVSPTCSNARLIEDASWINYWSQRAHCKGLNIRALKG